ncbi:hypothetical protein AAVH_22631 [Aphelenchoides avenae]|nr:hypothetical protein AAVH_22631 [Aphelenchus avenae]
MKRALTKTIKMETVEFREDDEADVEAAWIPTSSDQATKRKKPAAVRGKTLPVKTDPDALMAAIVSIKNEVKTEPNEIA